MREILFRGKRADSGEWVYGYLSKSRGFDYKLHLCIDYEDRGCMLSSIVVPDTVGQYTGLTDKNVKKIFEGDIVHCVSRLDNANMVVIYEDGEFRLVLCKDFNDYKCGLGFYEIRNFAKEVIGNIHDNPELLIENENGTQD